MPPSVPFCFGLHDSLSTYVQRYACCREYLHGRGVAVTERDISAHITWDQVCKQAHVDSVLALGDFAVVVHHARVVDGADWTEATLDELIHNLIYDHHAFVHCQLGRMGAMLSLLLRTAPRPSERLDRARSALTCLSQRWSAHMEMEEQDFFPACLRLDTSRDLVDRDELDRLVSALHRTSHDHREINLFAERLEQALEMVEDDIASEKLPVLRCLSECLAQFIDDARIHAAKEDDILLPAVLFVHDIRRSDSESGRFSNL